MPKPKLQQRPKQSKNHRNSHRHPNHTKSISQRFNVRRRLALYPKTEASTWLQDLSWYGSFALKLITALIAVTDDLEGEQITIGAGVTMLLGPGDFAAVSPVASQIYTKSDKEVLALRAIPYERIKLRTVHVRIAPSVEQGSRGGMYAALLIPLDQNDTESIGAAEMLARYPSDYDTIIANPRSVLSPVTQSITLRLTLRGPPVDARVYKFDNSKGWLNACPSCVLMVAYSDLANSKEAVADNYAPQRSLFEVHVTGAVDCMDPTPFPTQKEQHEDSDSAVTQKILNTFTSNDNSRLVHIFGKSVSIKEDCILENGNIDLTKLHPEISRNVLIGFDRVDLLPALQIKSLSSSLSTI